jgi:hypothetical protein
VKSGLLGSQEIEVYSKSSPTKRVSLAAHLNVRILSLFIEIRKVKMPPLKL